MLLSELTTEIWKKIDPYYQRCKYSPGSLLSDSVSSCGYSWEFLARGPQTTVWWILVAIESAYTRLPTSYCNLGPASHRFWDTKTYWLKIANFLCPSLIYRTRSGVTLFEFLKKLDGSWKWVFRGADSEDFMILACVVLMGPQIYI